MARSFETLWAESAVSLDYVPAAENIKGSQHIDAYMVFERHQSNQAHDLDLRCDAGMSDSTGNDRLSWEGCRSSGHGCECRGCCIVGGHVSSDSMSGCAALPPGGVSVCLHCASLVTPIVWE